MEDEKLQKASESRGPIKRQPIQLPPNKNYKDFLFLLRANEEVANDKLDSKEMECSDLVH